MLRIAARPAALLGLPWLAGLEAGATSDQSHSVCRLDARKTWRGGSRFLDFMQVTTSGAIWT
jgi:hypothetical protein